ncbi:hypothetical protein ITJ86_01185 [Winogradskyella sp. F6397]|uniref:DUF4249 family protein n=1 Tax=Winogradskyella marina TaxID=2785530 RepID=A0ABS0EDI4_9FLAO|nr:hypothetical protein [Winogradskyella marina]MBF8148489.1 hypothetical protein [Winogradskyella marina]
MKLSKFLVLFILIILSSCSKDLDDNLTAIPVFGAQEAIAADSDLFDNLKDITTDNERPDKSIACINFIYPITLFVFDDNNEYLYLSRLYDDDEFSNFLNTIDETYYISISFPITTMLDSGEELIIEDKEELKTSIDNCLDIEMVRESGDLMKACIFKLGFSFVDDNPYLGSFMQESDGFLVLSTTDDVVVVGSWTPFVIENELHININIIDDTAIGDHFNFDWKVKYLDANSLQLRHQDQEIILNQRCDANFTDCGNFNFEACETELESGIAEFILDDYTYCIFDTLEFDNDNENYEISYHETEEDAISIVNPIVPEETYTITEANQTLYLRINDIENNLQYYVPISLSAISC